MVNAKRARYWVQLESDHELSAKEKQDIARAIRDAIAANHRVLSVTDVDSDAFPHGGQL